MLMNKILFVLVFLICCLHGFITLISFLSFNCIRGIILIFFGILISFHLKKSMLWIKKKNMCPLKLKKNT
jgi:hypothetical protein